MKTIEQRKTNADFRLIYISNGRYTVTTDKGYKLGGRGVVRDFQNGIFEVTEKKYKEMQKIYTIEPDF